MKEVFINNHNLKTKDIDEEVIRVKGLIINSKNEILLGYSYNTYQFPGGHLEYGETLKEGLLREVKEETGMDVNIDDIKPFMMIKYFNKNYYNSGKNRCNKLYYFVIRTDNFINLNETNYTKEEKDGNFKLQYIKLDDIEDILISNSNKYPKYRTITYEMLEVISEFKNTLIKSPQ